MTDAWAMRETEHIREDRPSPASLAWTNWREQNRRADHATFAAGWDARKKWDRANPIDDDPPCPEDRIDLAKAEKIGADAKAVAANALKAKAAMVKTMADAAVRLAKLPAAQRAWITEVTGLPSFPDVKAE